MAALGVLTLQIQLAAERWHAGAITRVAVSRLPCGQGEENPDCDWTAAKTKIRSQIPETAFLNWFAPTRQVVRRGTAITVAVPDDSMRCYLTTDYDHVTKGVVSSLGIDEVEFIVPSASFGDLNEPRRSIPTNQRLWSGGGDEMHNTFLRERARGVISLQPEFVTDFRCATALNSIALTHPDVRSPDQSGPMLLRTPFRAAQGRRQSSPWRFTGQVTRYPTIAIFGETEVSVGVSPATYRGFVHGAIIDCKGARI